MFIKSFQVSFLFFFAICWICSCSVFFFVCSCFFIFCPVSARITHAGNFQFFLWFLRSFFPYFFSNFPTDEDHTPLLLAGRVKSNILKNISCFSPLRTIEINLSTSFGIGNISFYWLCWLDFLNEKAGVNEEFLWFWRIPLILEMTIIVKIPWVSSCLSSWMNGVGAKGFSFSFLTRLLFKCWRRLELIFSIL